ncbi:hypothetical protein [Sphingopyxis panaciterrae]
MFSIVSLALALATASTGTSGNSFCKPPESPIFSCDLGKKRVSVCAGNRLVTYRYGTIGKAAPEMQISSNGKDGRVHSDFVVGGGGGQQASLRFSNGDTHYIVFSGYTGSLTDSPGKQWSGLDVLNGTTSVRNRQCGAGKLLPLASSSIPAFVPVDEENGPFSGWR